MTARARAFLALGAYVCLAAHLSALLHVVVVRHATCPSHGEVVHGDAVEGMTAPAASDNARDNAGDDTASGHPPGEVEEQDDHCLLVATRRRDLAALPPVHSIGHLPEAPAVTVPPAPSAASVDPTALRRLAPKTSPPIA